MKTLNHLYNLNKKKLVIIAGISWLGLFLYQFRRAFEINFFQDDYAFLKLSRINSLSEFLHFYSPLRGESFRPFASESFYFVIHLLNYNPTWSHVIMFSTFILGVYFLGLNLFLLTKNKFITAVTLFFYSMHFSHVFQLYWYATFQEIALMTFLNLALYGLLTKRLFWGFMSFGIALLSKETAALFPILLIWINLFNRNKRISYKTIGLTFLISGVFYAMYRYGLSQVTSLDNYQMNFNIKFILNNMIWYLLWSIGLPNLMPLFTPSLLKFPIPEFYHLFKIPEFKLYIYLQIVYLATLLLGMLLVGLKSKKDMIAAAKWLVILGLGFYIFLGPILLFPHRWMVRLTLPLIFSSIFQAYILAQLRNGSLIKKGMVGFIMIMYVGANFFGTVFHESSSLFIPENDIYLRARKLFTDNRVAIEEAGILYFADSEQIRKYPTQNSNRLKNSFHDQSFLDHFFPGTSLKAVYGIDADSAPWGAYVIESQSLVK